MRGMKRSPGFSPINSTDVEAQAIGPVKTNPADSLSDWQVFKSICKTYLWPNNFFWLKFRVVLSISLLVFSKVLSITTPFVLKEIVNELSVSPAPFPISLLIIYGILKIFGDIFDQAKSAVFAPVSAHAMTEISTLTFRHILHLSYSYHTFAKPGELMRKLDRGSRGLDLLTRMALFNTAPLFVELLMVLGVFIFAYEAWFALIVAVSIYLYVYCTFKITSWRNDIRKQENTLDNLANNRLSDSISNYTTVKYFTNEEHQYEQYLSEMKRYTSATVKTSQSLALLNFVQAFIMTVALIMALSLCALRISQGVLDIGDFVLIMSYFLQIKAPLNFLGSSYRMIRQSLIDLKGTLGLLAEELDIQDPPEAKDLVVKHDGTGGRLEFKNVQFAYDPTRPLLTNISFVVEPGQTIALVGPSGSGKSTIVKLLYRFYDINAGQILIDGIDISQMTQKTLRSAISIVPQNIALFQDTIEYNIRYGRIDASEEEVLEASKAAQFHDFASSQPKGYDEPISGLRLSGGEAQRCGIARSLLKKPMIFVADEATSALDTNTEREIQDQINKVSKNLTTLIIAHRLSTIVHADMILVLQDGQIIERGTHDQLLSFQGLYSDLWNHQANLEAKQRMVAEASNALQTIVKQPRSCVDAAGSCTSPETDCDPACSTRSETTTKLLQLTDTTLHPIHSSGLVLQEPPSEEDGDSE